jgi:hypothetical protein
MNSCVVSYFLALTLLVACTPAAFSVDASKGAQRDNSGRRIAAVVPRIDHLHLIDGFNGGGETDKVQSKATAEKSGESEPDFGNRVLSGLSRSPELSPGMQKVLEQSTNAARGLSRVAAKRVGDLGIWISTVWRELNDFPQVTPNSPIAVPTPPPSVMKPLMEPSQKNSELWFTSEHRMKTVVNR